MPRWEPNARQRLELAALELFAEHGYDSVTVAGIAERAGLTKASYFRHFTDKRDAVFWGQDRLLDVIRQAVSAAEDAGARELVDAALDAIAAVFTPDRHPFAVVRQRVIDANPELRERLTARCAAIADTIATALAARGVPADVAQVAGQLGQLAFTTAHARWAATTDGHGFAAFTQQALDEAIAATTALGRR